MVVPGIKPAISWLVNSIPELKKQTKLELNLDSLTEK